MHKVLTSIALIIASPTLFAGGTHDHGHGTAEFSVGQPAAGAPDWIIDVSMRDTMRFVFSPEFDNLHDGEVIRLNVHNDGNILHEFSIGNAVDQVKHAQMMRAMPDMKHEDPNTVSLEPGASATLSWRFEGGDTVVFACNIPGHFEAGMRHDLAIMGLH